MNTDTALNKARALTPNQGKTAAHLYATTEWELAYIEQDLDNPLMDDKREQLLKQRQQGEAALAAIEEKFPGIKTQADEIETPRALSARATNGLAADHEHDHRSSTPAEAAGAKHGAPADTTPSTSRTLTRPGPRARRRLARARTSRSLPRQAIRAARTVDQATGSWGSDLWDWALGGVGLSLFFLVLTKPAGLSKLFTGASNVLSWVINPTIDPLRPTAGATK